MEKFRVIIAGSRSFNNYNGLRQYMDRVLAEKKNTHEIVIVSGHAKGADEMGERYAKERGYKVEMYPADWERYGKSAGYIRNEVMAVSADALVAFWDGESKGTEHMIKTALMNELSVKAPGHNDRLQEMLDEALFQSEAKESVERAFKLLQKDLSLFDFKFKTRAGVAHGRRLDPEPIEYAGATDEWGMAKIDLTFDEDGLSYGSISAGNTYMTIPDNIAERLNRNLAMLFSYEVVEKYEDLYNEEAFESDDRWFISERWGEEQGDYISRWEDVIKPSWDGRRYTDREEPSYIKEFHSSQEKELRDEMKKRCKELDKKYPIAPLKAKA